MYLRPYLNFGGNCAEAFRFYEQLLGGKVLNILTQGQVPPGGPPVAPDMKDKVMHARLVLDDATLMGSDVSTDRYQPMRSAYLSLSVDTDAEAERIYAALSEGGEVFMSMQETFFASRFAQLRDRFGVLWMILHEKAMR